MYYVGHFEADGLELRTQRFRQPRVGRAIKNDLAGNRKVFSQFVLQMALSDELDRI